MYTLYRPAKWPLPHPVTIEYDTFDEFNAYLVDCGITLKDVFLGGYKLYIDGVEFVA
jgi:hypothetical protein